MVSINGVLDTVRGVAIFALLGAVIAVSLFYVNVLAHEQGHVQIFVEVCEAEEVNYGIVFPPIHITNTTAYSSEVTDGYLFGWTEARGFKDADECRQAHREWEKEHTAIKIWWGEKAYKTT